MKTIRLKERDIQRITKRVLNEEEIDPYANKVYDPISDEWVSKEEDTELVGNSDNVEDYDEDYYEEANEYANELNDEISNHILHYLQQCLGEIDINNLIYDNQQKFENKYGKQLDDDITWEFLGIKILQQPIPKGGFNIKDLSYSLMEELEKRMEFQSEHEDPDSLTDYSDIG